MIPPFEFKTDNITENRTYNKQFISKSNSVYKAYDDIYYFDISYSSDTMLGDLKIPEVGGMVCCPKSLEQDKWLQERIKNIKLQDYYVGHWKFKGHETYIKLHEILQETDLADITYRCTKSSIKRCIDFLLANSSLEEGDILYFGRGNSPSLDFTLSGFIASELSKNVFISYHRSSSQKISIYSCSS